MSENYELIQELANNDVKVLKEKGMTYGDSWRKRGGAGAFMMLARKWDRIENIAQGAGYDIFKVGADNAGDVLDDIADLRRYLLLVEAHITGTAPKEEAPRKWILRPGADPENPKAGDWVEVEEEDCGPGAGYVNQDGPQNSLSWKGALATLPPTVGPFDVIQVRWKDGTHSAMLPHEFGKIAEWSKVEVYRVIRDGTNPEDCPLPEPVRRWGGPAARAGDHQHTISHTWPIGGHAQPLYSHTGGVVAGIASAVSGINAAVSAMPKV